VTESSGLQIFYIIRLLEAVNQKRKAGFGIFYEREDNSYHVREETLAKFENILGILSAFKSKPEEVITSI
jgi:hypothetical protein